MKIQKQRDGLEGYVVLVEKADIDKPLELPEVQGEWVDIIRRCEGVVRKDGLFPADMSETANVQLLPTEPQTRLHPGESTIICSQHGAALALPGSPTESAVVHPEE